MASQRVTASLDKASASGAEDPGLTAAFSVGIFPGRVIPVTSTLALQWLPCKAPGVTGSALGLVVPVSVYGDWVDIESLTCNFYLSVAARTTV